MNFMPGANNLEDTPVCRGWLRVRWNKAKLVILARIKADFWQIQRSKCTNAPAKFSQNICRNLKCIFKFSLQQPIGD